MATRAQRFRHLAERAGPKRAKRPPRRRRDVPVDTAKKGVSASHRKAGAGSTAARNRYGAQHDAGRVLENSDTGRPSRKSTRKGPLKAGTALTRRHLHRLSTAKVRASRLR